MSTTTQKNKAGQQSDLSPDEIRAIAKEAYIYGFPMVDHYRIQHAYFVDKNNPEFKAAWNHIYNNARVYTPDDKAIQTPNSDTPYSNAGADLRTEPIVITVPAVEKNRYYSLQFVDAYTFNFSYLGSRATGSEEGNFLLAGPKWKGEKPRGINKVIQSETELVMILYRTQLFGPEDIENVKKVQAGYKMQPLSFFLGQPAPPAAPEIDFIKPLTAEDERQSVEFFNVLSFILRFCPTHPSEKELMLRFEKIGIGAGKSIDFNSLPPEIQKAYTDGMADGLRAFKTFKEAEVDTGKRNAADSFGTREFLQNDYMARMSSALLGIYGNSKEEAMYAAYFVDAEGKQPDGAKDRYIFQFAAGQLPPVNAFWSLTLYELPASLLSANPINRYLINSTMLSTLKKDADGGITIFVQHQSPGRDKESNWLPAPNGLFFCVLRLYWPKKEALDGTWKQPPLERQK